MRVPLLYGPGHGKVFDIDVENWPQSVPFIYIDDDPDRNPAMFREIEGGPEILVGMRTQYHQYKLITHVDFGGDEFKILQHYEFCQCRGAVVGRLESLGIVDLRWDEQKNGNVLAYGMQDYIIDTNNVILVFLNGEHIKTRECIDFCHAVAIVEANEATCRWNIRNGKPKNSYQAQPSGFVAAAIRQLEQDLFQAYHEYRNFKDSPDWDEVDEGNMYGLAEGIAHALGVMRGNSCDEEFEAIKDKWESVYAKSGE